MGGFLALVDPIGKILDKVLPDRAANAAAKSQLLETEVQGEFSNALAQLQVDAQEAQSKSIWVAGWRPAVGWVCAGAFAYAFILQPFATFALVIFRPSFNIAILPKLDLNSMMPVLLGMLGLAGMRSYDKAKGTENGE